MARATPTGQVELRALLSDRIQAVEQRIQAACARAGRERGDVRLIAVTKTVTPEIARLLPELGFVDLGESRPQELWRKATVLPAGVRLHLVGHLQRNKIERTLPLVHLIHSVDSVRLLEALEQAADKTQRTLPVLLEVNASGEASKHGFAPAAIPGLANQIGSVRRIRVDGLMTMAAHDADAERSRPTFVMLRELRDGLRRALEAPDALPHLSMGMTNDFEVAIAEGATMVRVGTALFEGVCDPAT
ncbi:MAG TPA: YggS family pyridoxal phosphate-dependent enzyme [Gemmataceae bacterium]|nr:YggS family pyridoxal phosphate-dependent enzyme [Gemmataceae bacterium]